MINLKVYSCAYLSIDKMWHKGIFFFTNTELTVTNYLSTCHFVFQGFAEPNSRELVAIFIEIMLIPHFLVAYFAWGWAGQHPWIAYPVIVHCVWCMWGEGKQVVGWVRSANWEAWRGTNWRAQIPQLCK